MGYHLGVGAPPIPVYFGDWDVHWGYGILTHDHITRCHESTSPSGIEGTSSVSWGTQPYVSLCVCQNTGDVKTCVFPFGFPLPSTNTHPSGREQLRAVQKLLQGSTLKISLKSSSRAAPYKSVYQELSGVDAQWVDVQELKELQAAWR